MIDLSTIAKVGAEVAKAATNNNQVRQKQQTNAAQSTQKSGDPQSDKALNGLSALLAPEKTESPETNADLAELQKQAAQISARVNALVAEANALEDNLNLAPTPESVDVSELLSEFREIIAQLTEDMNALQKKVQEQKEQNAMDVKQKPTAAKAGESAIDPSYNTQLSLQ